jgi:MFS family permease
MLATLRHRDFALVWGAGLVSLLGDRALLTALPYYVYQQTGSTLATATMFTAYYLPTVLLGSVAGVFVDRWDRTRIMVVANLIQTGVVLLLLLVRSAAWLWLIYVAFCVEIAVATFFQPAESAFLPHLVHEERLVSANALTALNNNIARLAGPPIGGVLVGFFGLSSVALFDSASFLVAAVLLLFVSVAATPAQGITDVATAAASTWARVWMEWRQGLGLVKRDRLIARLFVVACVTTFGGAMFDPLIAPWVRSVLDGGAAALGWLSTIGAVGGLLGGLLLGRFGRDMQPARLFGIGNLLAGSLLLVMYNLHSLTVVQALCFCMSVPLVGSGAGLQTLLQAGVPDRYRGRVYGALGTTSALVGLASIWLAGAVGQLLGIVPMLSVAAGVTILAGMLGLVLLPTGTSSELAQETASQSSS